MYNIEGNLKKKIGHLNERLLDKYKDLFSLDKTFLRQFIGEKVGPIERIDRLTAKQLGSYLDRGGILGVDGSNNRMGGAYPHFVEIYQGLAKSTLHRDQPIFKADFYTPLYSEEGGANSQEEDRSIRSQKLSAIELEVAIEGVKRLNPCVVFMDGSLIRYYIENRDKWMELKEECQTRGIILIGIIKDIKTSIIGDLLVEDRSSAIKKLYYDRELLYGLLEYGEVIYIQTKVTKKAEEGLSSLFIRSSGAPNVIGMDILARQDDHLEDMARLVLSLTPRDGRGVPLWIDIVDNEVRIPNQMIRALLESYLDREILEKLFISERDNRII